MTSIILPSNATDPSQIVSSTLPTTRVNPSTGLPSGGAALQIGDRWYKPSLGREGFWNGTLWLSVQRFYQSLFRDGTFSATFSGTNSTEIVFSGLLGKALFLESYDYRVNTLTGGNDSNYWQGNLLLLRVDGISQTLENAGGVTVLTPPITAAGSGNVAVNSVFYPSQTMGSFNYINFNYTFTKVGSPNSLARPVVTIYWREVLT